MSEKIQKLKLEITDLNLFYSEVFTNNLLFKKEDCLTGSTGNNLLTVNKHYSNLDIDDLSIHTNSGIFDYKVKNIIDNLKSGKYKYYKSKVTTFFEDDFIYQLKFNDGNLFISFNKDTFKLKSNLQSLIKCTNLKEVFDKLNNENISVDKSSLNNLWKIGTYIVPLQNKILHRNQREVTKGKIYEIIDYTSVPYILSDDNGRINFFKDERKAGIKWFATYKEAAEFSKSLEFKENKIKSVNISSNHFAEIEFPATPDECVKKASKLNRKLLLL